jgi:hypothetical protein
MEGAPSSGAVAAPVASFAVSHEDVVKSICEFCRLSGYHETVRILQKESLVPFNTVSCVEELPAQADSPRRGGEPQQPQSPPARASSQNADTVRVHGEKATTITRNTLEEALLKGKWGTVLPLLDRLLLSMPTQFVLLEGLILDLCMDPGLASAAEQLLFHSPPLKQLKKAQGTRFARLEHLVRTAKAHPERMATEPGCSAVERANVRKAAWVALASEIRCIEKTAEDGSVHLTHGTTANTQPAALLFQAIANIIGAHGVTTQRKRPRAGDDEAVSKGVSKPKLVGANVATDAAAPKRLVLLADLSAVADPAGASAALEPHSSGSTVAVSASSWIDATTVLLGTQNGSLILFRPRPEEQSTDAEPATSSQDSSAYVPEVLTKGNMKNGPIVALVSSEVEFQDAATQLAPSLNPPAPLPYFWVGAAFLDGTIKVYGLRLQQGLEAEGNGEAKKRWQLLRVIKVADGQGMACLCFVGRPWAWTDESSEQGQELFDAVLCYGMNDGTIGLCSVLRGEPNLATVNAPEGAEGQVLQLSAHFTGSAATSGSSNPDQSQPSPLAHIPQGTRGSNFYVVASFANGSAASIGPLSLLQVLSGEEYPAPTKRTLMTRQHIGSASGQVLLGFRDQKEDSLSRLIAAMLGHPIPLSSRRLLLCPKAVPWHTAVAIVVDLTSGVVLDRVQLKDAATVLAQEDRDKLTVRQVTVQGRNVYFLLSNNTVLCRSDLASLMWRSGSAAGGAGSAGPKSPWTLFSLMHLTPESSIGDDRKARSTLSTPSAIAASNTVAEGFRVAPASLDSATSSFVAASNRWLLWSRGSLQQGQNACALALLA